MCQTWADLDYPVTVLDGGAFESADNPGLEQILEFPMSQPPGGLDESTWRVIPAAHGLKGLLSAGRSLVDIEGRLTALCPEDGVVIVYAQAEMLAPLLRNTRVQPVVVASSEPNALLACYLALKRMLSVPGLEPLLIDIPCNNPALHPGAAQTLADCTQNYLNHPLQVARLRAAHEDAPAAADMQRLALRVLESAQPLSGRWPPMPHNGTKIGAGQINRSH
ncbi:MAG: hypothetical protein CFE44_16070 [Burkholderiales bacterium PBB4]|nr:MAG: hypothetical protein CFE44_16070 [Burkholderiales bacterium PBB4]